MRVLLIGYGSIGKRHFNVLSNFDTVSLIDIVTKQKLTNKSTYKNLKDIDDLSIYDYFVIATETSKHFEQLNYLCSNVTNKRIIVEKPFFDKEYNLEDCNNNICVAYNLRFHPLLQTLKEILKDEDIYYANILAGQYLPTWRPNQDYKKSYSAKLSLGGGVLRDLSHELDYINWLFGKITVVSSINTKISDLEIESDDIFTALIKTDKAALINVTMDYISKTPLRRITIHTKAKTIEVDMVTNTINLFDKNGIKSSINPDKVHRDYTYTNMHQAIINNNFENVCSFEEGLQIVDIIEETD